MTERRPVVVYENPAADEILEPIKEAIAGRRTLILVGNCRVDYRGRASSRLEPGERILTIKEDGSVLVHRSNGYEPVNWQPPGCLFRTFKDKDALVIRATRQRPHEVITIHFDRVYLLSLLSLIDKGEFALYASEEDMQRAIISQPSLVEEGLKLITHEKRVDPGFIDIYGVDRDDRMVVIEIKRKRAGREAILQLAKYVESLKVTGNREVRGILVAPQISKGVQKLLITLGLDFRPLDPRRCTDILRKIETKKLAEFF